jgi:hypothetical protein
MNRIRIWIMLAVTAGTTCGCHSLPILPQDHDNRFALYLPEATEVLMLSSLNQYKPVSMKKTISGEWEIHLPKDIAFDYFYQVDGIPYTPECRLQQTDDWGGRQCIYSPGIQEP